VSALIDHVTEIENDQISVVFAFHSGVVKAEASPTARNVWGKDRS